MDIRNGALTLLQALPYLPDDAVVIAAVDPGTGTDRAALAVRTAKGRLMVGPDNGVLSLAWAMDGGVREAVSVTAAEVLVQPVSPVLNVRDIFAPGAAHLARGADLAQLGEFLDPGALVAIAMPTPEIGAGRLAGEVLDVDRFGNVRLNVRSADLDAAGFDPDAMLEIASTAASSRARRITTYSQNQDGECGALQDAWGWLLITRFGTSAAELLMVSVGDPVWVTAAD
jgi:S-adenosylmethionine hydrolase